MPLQLSRRNVLSGALASLALPSIIKTFGLLMPIKPKKIIKYSWYLADCESMVIDKTIGWWSPAGLLADYAIKVTDINVSMPLGSTAVLNNKLYTVTDVTTT